MENLLNALRTTAKPLMSIAMAKIGRPTDDVWLMYEGPTKVKNDAFRRGKSPTKSQTRPPRNKAYY